MISKFSIFSGVENDELGSSDEVTELDIKKVFKMYQCEGSSKYNVK